MFRIYEANTKIKRKRFITFHFLITLVLRTSTSKKDFAKI